jgi:hypothetical protein
MQNFNPIYVLTPNVGSTKIPTTAALVRSNGSGSIGTDMFLVWSAGVSGSLLQSIRFQSVANAAAVNSVATTLRTFVGNADTGDMTTASCYLLAEISVPLTSTANSTNATNYYDIPINRALPSGSYILVSQHVAQTTNQYWQATAFGGNY